MAQVHFLLTKREQSTNRLLRAETQADLTDEEQTELIDYLKVHGSPDFGDFATIYVEPAEYTLHINDEVISMKPQSFPAKYQYIINELTTRLA